MTTPVAYGSQRVKGIAMKLHIHQCQVRGEHENEQDKQMTRIHDYLYWPAVT